MTGQYCHAIITTLPCNHSNVIILLWQHCHVIILMLSSYHDNVMKVSRLSSHHDKVIMLLFFKRMEEAVFAARQNIKNLIFKTGLRNCYTVSTWAKIRKLELIWEGTTTITWTQAHCGGHCGG
jgi:hypothetical protein